MLKFITMFIVLFGARGAWALDFNDRIDQLISTLYKFERRARASLVVQTCAQ